MVDEHIHQRMPPFTSIANDIPLLPEIWLQILAYLLSPEINNASLTCQLLRQMAQPLLFRSLTIRPDRDAEGRCHPDGGEIQWFLRKLLFCSSNLLIAPAVRRLEIRPYYSPFDLTSDNHQNHNLILDEVFKRLPKFVNLVSIACHRIWCTSRHLIGLSKLGTLGTLELEDCLLKIPTGFSSTFRVLSLSISSQKQIPNDDWFSFFHSDSISIAIGDLYSSVLPDLVTSLNTIRHLHGLFTIVRRETLPLLAEVLSHSPPLQTLRLATEKMTKQNIGTLSCTPSPVLSTFQGPYELLHAICSTESLRKLRDLELSNLLPNGNDDPDNVLLALSLLGEATTRLEKLRFSVRYLTEDILMAVVSLCSNLRKLSISVVDRNTDGPSHADAYTAQVRIPIDTIKVILTSCVIRSFSAHWKQ